MARPVRLLARLLYLVAAVAVLAASLALLAGDGRVMEGPGQLVVYGMVVLSFPAGLAVVYAWGAAALTTSHLAAGEGAAGIAAGGPIWELVALWLTMLTAGYLQWFVGLPALRRRLRESEPK